MVVSLVRDEIVTLTRCNIALQEWTCHSNAHVLALHK